MATSWRARFDGWMNLVTGIGVPGADKRAQATVSRSILTYQQLDVLYRSNDLAATIVDDFVDEMFRKGFEIRVENDPDASKAINDALEQLRAIEKLHEATKWSRLFGGGGVLLGANDAASKSRTLAAPLKLDGITDVRFLTVFDLMEAQPFAYYADPFEDEEYGTPKTYRLNPQLGGTSIPPEFGTVHESRLLRFVGVPVTRRNVQEVYGYGDSVLQRVHEVLRDSDSGWASAALLLTDFAQGTLKTKGLREALASAEGAQLLSGRLQGILLSKSVARTMLLDEDEEFKREPTPMSGLPETLDRFMIRVAAAARMPVTRLWGRSAAGLNATGDNDVRNYYDRISAARIHQLQPRVRRLIDVLMAAKSGPTQGTVLPYTVYFPPLWELDEVQKADVRLKTSQADAADITSGVITPDEAALSHYSSPEYSTAIHLDMDARQAVSGARKEPEQPPAKEDSFGVAVVEGLERRFLRQDAADDAPTGVAVVLPVETALPGNPTDAHITLAYLGKVGDFTPEALKHLSEVLDLFARSHAPVRAKASGVGRFSVGSLDCAYLSVDGPGLSRLREQLVDALAGTGFPPVMEHGFSPHITLTYLAKDAPQPLERMEPVPLFLDGLALWAGAERMSFGLQCERIDSTGDASSRAPRKPNE